MDYSHYQARLEDMMMTAKDALISQLLKSSEPQWRQEAVKLQQLPPADFIDYACTLVDPRIEVVLNELCRIDAALCQGELGLYGICSDCEDSIEEERLEADPCTQRCEKCETKRHLQKRQDLFAL
ncbi:TraR/DksA family transcriptional regulator [Celerinatantimonas yamalensis]|uniref:TraR/DksA C4-type zinc finger protein n=1 Tax=Celerinatantimonas yamalensis TaxID=559956 RepID=A0ABW9G2N4_9GAMM